MSLYYSFSEGKWEVKIYNSDAKKYRVHVMDLEHNIPISYESKRLPIELRRQIISIVDLLKYQDEAA